MAVAAGAGGALQTRSAALLGLGLALLAAAVFAPMRGHEWLVYDDDLYITANPALRLGWSAEGVAWAFSTFHGANWFPLTWLSWMLDYDLFGLDAPAFHTSNLLLHAAASVLLFLALLRMTSLAGRSAFVAAVFAVHPLHVEPVAWAAGRKDPLSAVFFAAVLLVWAGCGRHGPSRRRMALVFALLGAGLLAKPTLLTLPFVLLLLDAWPLARLGHGDDPTRLDPRALWRAILEKWPLFALVAAMTAVVFIAQHSAGAMAELSSVSLSERLANAVVAYVVYLRQAFVPTDLAVFYPHLGESQSLGRVTLSLLVLVLTSGLALACYRRVPAVCVGWLWFLGMLVPMLGLVQVGSQAHADRYTYLPLIGLSIAVSWGVAEAAGRVVRNPVRRRRLLGAIGVATIAALALAASLQLRHWRDSEALMRHALAVTRENHIAHAYLGVALLEQGEVDAAIENWRESVRIQPGYRTVANNLAWLLATAPEPRHRSPEEAIRLAQSVRSQGPDDPAVLDTLAAAYAAASRFEEARSLGGQALSLAKEQGQQALAAELAQRLALYQRGLPYVER